MAVAGMGWFTYKREHAETLPIMVMAIENYGRVYRLLKANVPVSIEMDVETEFTGDHEHGFDTIAEIPGTDPKLKDEVVMVGGHSIRGPPRPELPITVQGRSWRWKSCAF